MSSEHLHRRLVKSLIGIKSKLRLSAEAHQHNLILLLLSVASLFSINHWSGVTDIWFEWSWWCPHVCMSKLLHSVILRQLTQCGRKTKQTEQPRHWTQWPLSPLTRCGRKTKQPSCCAWWWLLSEQPNGIQRTKPCIIVLPIQCWIIVLPIQCWIIVLPLNLARADSQQNVLWDTALHFSLRTTSINNIYCGRLSLYLLSMIEIYMLALSWWKYCKNSPNGWYFVFFFLTWQGLYEVTVVHTEDSDSLGLSGDYLITVRQEFLCLHHIKTGNRIMQWELEHLPRFRLQRLSHLQDMDKVLSIQAGKYV